MTPVVDAMKKVAATSATVLLLGESGTCKDVAARAIHRWSSLADGPFVAVNCAALAESLLESELFGFGHEKGAFTGAHTQRRGRLELARGGTFFLDEIGELKPELQVKLLRVVQERQFERVGGTRRLEADVRWIAATNQELKRLMEEGRFREDLYHRLAVFPICIPPLRERRKDIPHLTRQLLESIAGELGRRGLQLDDGAMELLQRQDWPGNVRELRNALERAAILADDVWIRPEHLWLEGPGTGRSPAGGMTLAEVERAAILRALAECGENREHAADRLGIGLRTLYEKLKKHKAP